VLQIGVIEVCDTQSNRSPTELWHNYSTLFDLTHKLQHPIWPCARSLLAALAKAIAYSSSSSSSSGCQAGSLFLLEAALSCLSLVPREALGQPPARNRLPA
jgi:hypothetical protein